MTEASMVREAAQKQAARIVELEDKHYSECAQIARYDDDQNKRDTIIQSLLHTIEEQKAEIAALKRLLQQALTDFQDTLADGDACYFCNRSGSCTECEPEWRYAAEAEKLLSDSEVHYGSD